MAISTSVVSPHMPTGFVSAVAAGGRYVIGIGTNPGGTVGVFTVYDSVDDSMNAYEWSPASGVSLGVGDVARPLFGGVATLMPGGLVVCFPDGTYDAYALSWPIGPKSGSLFSWDTNGSTLTVFFYTGSGLSAVPTAGNPVAWGFDLVSGKWRFILSDGSGNPYASISDPSSAVTGQWYHLVGTFQASGTASKLYVNGAQVASSTSTAGTRYTTPCPVQIGRYNQTWSQFFPGRLAACALYNTVLSAAQVTNHYSAGA